MQPGYVLSATAPNPDAPDWAKSVINATQPSLDYQYLHGSGNSLDHYYSACETWKTTEAVKRENSPDPVNYVPNQFTGKIPTREIYDWDPENGLISHFTTDPNIPSPKLDPYVKPAPKSGFVSTIADVQTAANNRDTALFNMLIKIQASLDKLLAK